MLTKHQGKLIGYLGNFLENEGHAPSYDQIAKAIGLNSKSCASRLVHALKDRGLIEVPPNKRRALTLTEEGWMWAKRNEWKV